MLCVDNCVLRYSVQTRHVHLINWHYHIGLLFHVTSFPEQHAIRPSIHLSIQSGGFMKSRDPDADMYNYIRENQRWNSCRSMLHLLKHTHTHTQLSALRRVKSVWFQQICNINTNRDLINCRVKGQRIRIKKHFCPSTPQKISHNATTICVIKEGWH